VSFFFSSRRRHTSFSRDWSSDVCSSDLLPVAPTAKPTPTGFATIDGETPAPIETGAPVEPTAPPADGFTTLTDDLGVLSIQVPRSEERRVGKESRRGRCA